jgi:hypothetical protein
VQASLVMPMVSFSYCQLLLSNVYGKLHMVQASLVMSMGSFSWCKLV